MDVTIRGWSPTPSPPSSPPSPPFSWVSNPHLGDHALPAPQLHDGGLEGQQLLVVKELAGAQAAEGRVRKGEADLGGASE
jgi:hypothetical protein